MHFDRQNFVRAAWRRYEADRAHLRAAYVEELCALRVEAEARASDGSDLPSLAFIDMRVTRLHELRARIEAADAAIDAMRQVVAAFEFEPAAG